MKKVLLALTVIATLSLTSCKQEEKQETTTEVVADSTSVETAKVDTVKVDTVKVEETKVETTKAN